jgi:hypothetical protein
VTRLLPLSSLTLDPRVQPRATIDPAIVTSYAQAMIGGADFPPVTVLGDGIGGLWLVDGFHRVLALAEAGFQNVECDVQPGGIVEAVIAACGVNADHGWRRSNEDKHRAVNKLLAEDWGIWSDSEIADLCKVSRRLVASLRGDAELDQGFSLATSTSESPSLVTSTSEEGSASPAAPDLPLKVRARATAIQAQGGQPRVYTSKHGTPAVMDTSKIGKREPKEKPNLTVVPTNPVQRLIHLAEEMLRCFDEAEELYSCEMTKFQYRRLSHLVGALSSAGQKVLSLAKQTITEVEA